MTPEQFAVWLDGFLAGAGKALTGEQLDVVRAKLMTVKTAPQLPLPVPQLPPQPVQPLWPQPWPQPFHLDGTWTCACGARVGTHHVHQCPWVPGVTIWSGTVKTDSSLLASIAAKWTPEERARFTAYMPSATLGWTTLTAGVTSAPVIEMDLTAAVRGVS